MNLQERIIVVLLTTKDRILNWITLGLWEQVRGDVTWNEIKIKGE